MTPLLTNSVPAGRLRSAAASLAVAILGGWTGAACLADEAVEHRLERTFAHTVLPFLATHCAECHMDGAAEGDLDLGKFAAMEQVVDEHERWALVLERLETEKMPPEEASSHPEPAERQAIVDWIRGLRDYIAQRDAGDPGPPATPGPCWRGG
jgi:mono/diheme cytochrome c family protein